MDQAFADHIGRQPPEVAKKWLVALGKDPDDFKDGVPGTGLPAGVNPAPGSTPPAGPVALPPVVGGGRVRGGPVVGRAGGPVRPAAGVAVPSPPVLPAAGWRSEPWCTPGLEAQISEATAAQGTDRDERSLLSASVSSTADTPDGTNETHRVTFDNGMVGYHKPFDGLNDNLARSFGHHSAQQSVHEVAAWQLASKMGPPWSDIVPPCVVREVNGRMGSLAVERPGSPMSRTPWQVPEWREAAFFDVLIGQQDRHPGNYLVAGDRMTLIDHGYAFARPGDYLNWSYLGAKRFAEDPVLTHTERSFLDRFVASPDLLGLKGVLEADRADALRDRAERMRKTGRVLDQGDY